MVEGIDISQEDADKQIVPEDLNSLAVGSYIVPNPKRRKTFGVMLIITALISQVITSFYDWLNITVGVILVILIGIFILFIDNTINVKQSNVIENVVKHIPHSIGYYSIALTFQFMKKYLFLKPVWTVIVYDHNNPPTMKTIIEIDASTAELVSETYTESLSLIHI